MTVLSSTRLGIWFWLALTIAVASPARASKNQPLLTFTEGEVGLFSDPANQVHETVPPGALRVKYEGRYYLSRKVKPGDELPYGAWLRTLPGARARVVFPNGDQINVGPASFMKLVAREETKSRESTESLELGYGMVRSIISKSGPRSRFRVRTSTATMGVRGTDFVVESRPQAGTGAAKQATSLTLIRGTVDLQSSRDPKPRPVAAGQTAFVTEKKAVETFATSQTELKRVVVLTEKPRAVKPSETGAAEIPAAVRELEQKAREVTKTDILAHVETPEERAKVEKLLTEGADAATLNQVAVAARVEKAPEKSPGLERLIEEAKRRTKRSAAELKDLEKDPYGLYFEGTQ